MSLEKAIQKLTNAITTAKMDRSLMGGPDTPNIPIKPETYGSVDINGRNCTCVKKEVGMCVEAKCPDGSTCRLVFDNMGFRWSCSNPNLFGPQYAMKSL